MKYMTIQVPNELLKEIKKFPDNYWNEVAVQAILKRIKLAKINKK